MTLASTERERRKKAQAYADLDDDGKRLQALPTLGFAVFSSVLHEKSFTDDDGVEWRRRGAKESRLQGKELERALLKADVLVLHEYFGEGPPYRKTLPLEARKKFWENAVQSMQASPHSDFYGGEFTNDKHQHLLVVHEDC